MRKLINKVYPTYKYLLLLFVSAFLIFSYNNIFMTITPLYLKEIGGSQFDIGLQSTIFLISAVLLRFIFGPLADMKGNKFIMLIGAGAFLLASPLFIFADQAGHIMLLRIIQSIGLAAFFPCASAAVVSYAPKGKAGKYLGTYRLVTTSTLLFGPMAALSLITEKGYILLYLIMAMAALVGFIFILQINNQQVLMEDDCESESFLSTLQKLKSATPIFITTFVFAISYGLLFNFTIIFVNEYTNIANPAQFYTLFGIGGLIASIFLGTISDKHGRIATIVFSFIVLGTAISCFKFIPSMPSLFFVLGFFSGLGYSGGIVITMAWISDTVKSSIRTSALAMQQNCIDLGIAFGSLVFGLIFNHLKNDPTIFAYTGILFILYSLILIPLQKKMKKRGDGSCVSIISSK